MQSAKQRVAEEEVLQASKTNAQDGLANAD